MENFWKLLEQKPATLTAICGASLTIYAGIEQGCIKGLPTSPPAWALVVAIVTGWLIACAMVPAWILAVRILMKRRRTSPPSPVVVVIPVRPDGIGPLVKALAKGDPDGILSCLSIGTAGEKLLDQGGVVNGVEVNQC